jgi:hypothetical protein
MVGRPKGTVDVVVVGARPGGARYATTRTFHLCLPVKRGHESLGSPYLKRV